MTAVVRGFRPISMAATISSARPQRRCGLQQQDPIVLPLLLELTERMPDNGQGRSIGSGEIRWAA